MELAVLDQLVVQAQPEAQVLLEGQGLLGLQAPLDQQVVQGQQGALVAQEEQELQVALEAQAVQGALVQLEALVQQVLLGDFLSTCSNKHLK